jgi:hypothetical protein
MRRWLGPNESVRRPLTSQDVYFTRCVELLDNGIVLRKKHDCARSLGSWNGNRIGEASAMCTCTGQKKFKRKIRQGCAINQQITSSVHAPPHYPSHFQAPDHRRHRLRAWKRKGGMDRSNERRLHARNGRRSEIMVRGVFVRQCGHVEVFPCPISLWFVRGQLLSVCVRAVVGVVASWGLPFTSTASTLAAEDTFTLFPL